MKKVISVLLTAALSLFGLVGCGSSQGSFSTLSASTFANASGVSANAGSVQNIADIQTADLEFSNLSDPQLQRYVEDAVYADLVDQLDSDEYFVENVEVTYVSKEYLDELAYNTQSNIYFGYTLAELEDAFQGQKYIFTLGDDGQTTVKVFEGYDDTYDQVIRNIAIGSSVILVCVTISVVTGGAGIPAASMIFAASAKTGTIVALSSGVISGSAAAIFKGIETGDMDEAVKAGVLAGSEEFMWGAIGGAVTGGAGEAVVLHGATANGLTMNQVAAIQKESKYPLDVIKQFSTMEQYEVCKNAGLTPKMINGQTALIRDIDLSFVDDMGRTNLERMQEGLAARDPATGEAYELHHIGQQVDSTLAILSQEEHRLEDSYKIWHKLTESEVHAAGNNWGTQREEFWQSMYDAYTKGGSL